MGICLLVEWLATMVVCYSDHHVVNRPVFRPPFEYRSANQMLSTILNNDWNKPFTLLYTLFSLLSFSPFFTLLCPFIHLHVVENNINNIPVLISFKNSLSSHNNLFRWFTVVVHVFSCFLVRLNGLLQSYCCILNDPF